MEAELRLNITFLVLDTVLLIMWPEIRLAFDGPIIPECIKDYNL